jgi:hypothetical protein
MILAMLVDLRLRLLAGAAPTPTSSSRRAVRSFEAAGPSSADLLLDPLVGA